MNVNVTSDPIRGVTKNLGDELHLDTHCEQQRTGRVAQLMNSPLTKPRTLAILGKSMTEVVRVNWCAFLRGEYEVVFVLPQ